MGSVRTSLNSPLSSGHVRRLSALRNSLHKKGNLQQFSSFSVESPWRKLVFMKSFRVLLVDHAVEPKDRNRKERISLLKANGLTVYPAFDLQQARERCKPGRYDLIIVNAGSNPGLALAMCDEIVRQDSKQLLLLMVTPEMKVPRRSYLVSDNSEILLGRVKALPLLARDRSFEPMPLAA